MRRRKGRRGNIGIGLGVGVPYPQLPGVSGPGPIPASSSVSAASSVSASPGSSVSVSPVSVSPRPSSSVSAQSISPGPTSLSSSPSAVLTCASFGTPVFGDAMANATVQATFTDATTQTATWANGVAQGTNWFLSETGDTLLANWYLNNNTGKGITQVVINLQPAGYLFNSNTGYFFVTGGNLSTDAITATYQRAVARAGFGADGSRWAQLQISFTNSGGFDGFTPLLLEDGFTPLLLEDGTKLYLESGSGRTLSFMAATELCVGPNPSLSSQRSVSSSSASYGDNIGGFGGTNLQMLWHVQAENGVVQVTDGSGLCVNTGVSLWGDLVDSHDLNTLVWDPAGTVGYTVNLGTNATPTGKPQIQINFALGVIFCQSGGLMQGNYNFFRASGQFTYGIFFRGTGGANYALIDDGTPFQNGLAIGFGNPDLDSAAGTPHFIATLDGTNTGINSGILVPTNGVLLVTYDGKNGGAINFYVGQSNNSPPFYTLTSAGPFSQMGLDATGGLAIAGTYGNSDPGRTGTLGGASTNHFGINFPELAIWQGVMNLDQVTNLVVRCRDYYGFG